MGTESFPKSGCYNWICFLFQTFLCKWLVGGSSLKGCWRDNLLYLLPHFPKPNAALKILTDRLLLCGLYSWTKYYIINFYIILFCFCIWSFKDLSLCFNIYKSQVLIYEEMWNLNCGSLIWFSDLAKPVSWPRYGIVGHCVGPGCVEVVDNFHWFLNRVQSNSLLYMGKGK